MSEKSFQPSPNPQPSDLTAIAAMLNEAAQALIAFSGTPSNEKAVHTAAAGETRCYYLSPAMLKHERELLQRYRVDDFNGLLVEAHSLLAGLVKIIKSTHPDARLRGRSVANLGSLLEQVSSLLVRMCNIYEKAESRPA